MKAACWFSLCLFFHEPYHGSAGFSLAIAGYFSRWDLFLGETVTLSGGTAMNGA